MKCGLGFFKKMIEIGYRLDGDDRVNYLAARNAFLASCGRLTPQERERAIELFDQTLVAHQARLADAWTAFWEAVFPWKMR